MLPGLRHAMLVTTVVTFVVFVPALALDASVPVLYLLMFVVLFGIIGWWHRRYNQPTR